MGCLDFISPQPFPQQSLIEGTQISNAQTAKLQGRNKPGPVLLDGIQGTHLSHSIKNSFEASIRIAISTGIGKRDRK